MSINKNWLKEITKTPNPYDTPGISFHRSFVIKNYRLGYKIYLKEMSADGHLRYRFDSIYMTDCFLW